VRRFWTCGNFLDQTSGFDYIRFPEVLFEVIHLAGLYTTLQEWANAGSLFSQVIPKLELLNDAKFEIEKLYAYMEYGVLHLRQDGLQEAADCLRLAKSGLESLNRHTDEVALLMDSLLLKVDIRVCVDEGPG
jgi:hypothetical protein